jgi:predicted  nucleic acid-binding Zn-ribbon protein
MKASASDQVTLLTLHDIDVNLERLTRERRHLPEAGRLADIIVELATLGPRLVEATGAVESAQAEILRIESDVVLVAERMRRDEALRDQSTNSKEVLALEHEIATLARRASELDDSQLAVMQQRENAESALAAVTVAISETNQRRQEVDGRLSAQSAQVDADLAALELQRISVVSSIPQDLYDLYVKQRERYGIGAGLLVGGVSLATGMHLSERDLDIVRHAEADDVLICPESSCILVRAPELGEPW